jgi:hypothetical protein
MSETGPQSEFIAPKVTKRSLNIPHTMELVETVEPLELLMHMNYFFNPCRDLVMVVDITKPLDKLAELRDNQNELVGRGCIE